MILGMSWRGDDSEIIYSKLRINGIQWDLKNISDYAEKNAFLVSLTRKIIRITQSGDDSNVSYVFEGLSRGSKKYGP